MDKLNKENIYLVLGDAQSYGPTRLQYKDWEYFLSSPFISYLESFLKRGSFGEEAYFDDEDMEIVIRLEYQNKRFALEFPTERILCYNYENCWLNVADFGDNHIYMELLSDNFHITGWFDSLENVADIIRLQLGENSYEHLITSLRDFYHAPFIFYEDELLRD